MQLTFRMFHELVGSDVALFFCFGIYLMLAIFETILVHSKRNSCHNSLQSQEDNSTLHWLQTCFKTNWDRDLLFSIHRGSNGFSNHVVVLTKFLSALKHTQVLGVKIRFKIPIDLK